MTAKKNKAETVLGYIHIGYTYDGKKRKYYVEGKRVTAKQFHNLSTMSDFVKACRKRGAR